MTAPDQPPPLSPGAPAADAPRWPLTNDHRRLITLKLLGIVGGPGSRDVDRIKAAAVLKSADGLNAVREKMAQDDDRPPAPTVAIGAVNILSIDITTATERQLEEAIRAGVAIPAEELAKLPADVLVRLHRATARLSGSS